MYEAPIFPINTGILTAKMQSNNKKIKLNQYIHDVACMEHWHGIEGGRFA